MKQSLGKIVIFIILSTLLFSEDFIYKIDIDNNQPYLKEPIILNLEINQTNHNKVIFFKFDLKKSKEYIFKRIDAIDKGKHHFAHLKYSYLIYPLKEGKIDIEFKLKKRVTNDESLSYSYSGDRDNIKLLVTEDSDIELPPTKLNVIPLPKDTEIVGDFKLKYHCKTHKAKSYQPIPINVEIKGRGYLPLIDNIIQSDKNITIFRDKPIIKSIQLPKDRLYTIEYPMAISSNKSFSLKPRTIKGFNPQTKESYLLSIPKQDFDIETIDKTTLIDKDNKPKPLERDFLWLRDIIYYIVIFVAGYLTAIAIEWRRGVKPKEKSTLYHKVKRSRDKRELLQILIATNQEQFKEIIRELEESIYNNKSISFKEIKEKLEKEIA